MSCKHSSRVWMVVMAALAGLTGPACGVDDDVDLDVGDVLDATDGETGGDIAAEDAAPDETPDVPPDMTPDETTDVPADTTPDTTPDEATDVPTDAGDADDGGVMVTVNGIVNDFFGAAIGGATISVTEDPSRTATTGFDGRFALSVPAETPMTLLATRSGFVDTLVQTAIPHIDTALTLWMATPDNYSIMVAAGGGSPSDAVFYVSIQYGALPCDLTGSLVTTSPATGRVVYGRSDGYPDGSLTSLPPGSRWAYVVGPTGTTAPQLTSSSCSQTPYPVYTEMVTVVGPIDVRPGSFHVMNLYLD